MRRSTPQLWRKSSGRVFHFTALSNTRFLAISQSSRIKIFFPCPSHRRHVLTWDKGARGRGWGITHTAVVIWVEFTYIVIYIIIIKLASDIYLFHFKNHYPSQAFFLLVIIKIWYNKNREMCYEKKTMLHICIEGQTVMNNLNLSNPSSILNTETIPWHSYNYTLFYHKARTFWKKKSWRRISASDMANTLTKFNDNSATFIRDALIL